MLPNFVPTPHAMAPSSSAVSESCIDANNFCPELQAVCLNLLCPAWGKAFPNFSITRRRSLRWTPAALGTRATLHQN